ncbi:MAG: sulfotransferase family protein [Pseudomonadales bacterium]
MSEPAERSMGVLVLGAGRSGTSTLARALMALGVELGSRLKRPTRKNPRGFFEEVNLLAISKRVRRALGLRAEHVRLLTEEDWKNARLDGLRRGMRRAIEAAMGGADVWGFKYAGTGRLLPFWLPLLEEMNIRPAFVLAYRNPLSIAASRRQLDAERGQQEKNDLEWLANLVPYLHLTRGHPLVVVDYDRLLQDPRRELDRLSRMLGVSPTPRAIAAFVDDFLSPSLRHNQFDAAALKTDRSLHPLVRRGALLLDALAGEDGPPDDAFWECWANLRLALYDGMDHHAEVDRQIDGRRRARWWDVGTPLKRAWQARPIA